MRARQNVRPRCAFRLSRGSFVFAEHFCIKTGNLIGEIGQEALGRRSKDRPSERVFVSLEVCLNFETPLVENVLWTEVSPGVFCTECHFIVLRKISRTLGERVIEQIDVLLQL